MNSNEITKAIREGHARIIDVRSPMEYMGGHVAQSENIPLQDIPSRLTELLQEDKMIIFCCASGNRSGQATAFYQANGGKNAINGGSWLDVNYLVQI